MSLEIFPKYFNKKNEFLLALSYDITMACNNRCAYCSRLSELDNAKITNPEVFEEVIKQIKMFREKNPEYNIYLELLGGDPLVVIDKTIELIERLQDLNITLVVFSNFNFNPNGTTIKKLLSCKENNKFNLMCSWHESSNESWVKENLIKFQDITKPLFLINHSTLNKVEELIDWVIENTNMLYELKIITGYHGKLTFTEFENEIFNKITSNDRFSDLSNDLDDKTYNFKETKKFDLHNISRQFRTICKLAQFDIGFDGKVNTACEYKISHNISDGFPIKDIFCHNKTCLCDTQLYKKLYEKRD